MHFFVTCRCDLENRCGAPLSSQKQASLEDVCSLEAEIFRVFCFIGCLNRRIDGGGRGGLFVILVLNG